MGKRNLEQGSFLPDNPNGGFDDACASTQAHAHAIAHPVPATPKNEGRQGHRERPHKRFMEEGSDAVPDYELLELLLLRAIPRRDPKALAKRLIARLGSFAEVLNASEKLLRELNGVGDAVV